MTERRARLVALLSDYFDISPAEVETLLRRLGTDPVADATPLPPPYGTSSCEDYYCSNPFHEHDTYGWPACHSDAWAD